MIRSKNLYSLNPKDLITDGNHIELVAFGLFNTNSQVWEYFVCSVMPDRTGTEYIMTTDLHYEFKNLEDAKKFIHNFRDKWETGSNEPRQEVRDAKIKDILKEEEIK